MSRRATGRRGRARAQRGSASLLVVAVTGVVLLLGLAASFMTATAAGHRRVQSAADLAALAGATAAQQGLDPCSVAGAVAARNGARTTSCDIAVEVVTVSVVADGPELLGHRFRLEGRARAGPEPVDAGGPLPP